MSPTKLREIYALAQSRGINPYRYEELSDLIRTIQRVEGNTPCFATPYAEKCCEYGCRWRAECLALAGKSPTQAVH